MGRHRIELNGEDFPRPNGRSREPQERRTRTTKRAMTMQIGRPPPTDQRGFIHKKLLGGISKITGFLPIPGAQVVSRVSRFLGGGQISRVQPARVPARPVSRTTTARVSGFSRAEKRGGQVAKFGGPEPGGTTFSADSGPCLDPALVRAPDGHCVAPGSGHARRHGVGDGRVPEFAGEAVMGQFGAGQAPTFQTIQRSVCFRGMTLGLDGLCYNKGSITNKQRMWPRGRRPLLTGGDMRAIGVAARAGARLDRTTTRLRQLGMMKALPKARSRKCPPGRTAAPGTTIVQN